MENHFPGGARAVGRVRRMVIPSGACEGMTVGEVCESLDEPWTILSSIKGEKFKWVRDYGKLLKATSVRVSSTPACSAAFTMVNHFPGGAAAVGQVRRMVVPSGACRGMTVGEVCESLDDPWTILDRIEGEEFKLVRDFGKVLKATSALVNELETAGDKGRSSAAPRLPEGDLGATVSLPQAGRIWRDAESILLQERASQQVEPALALQLMPEQIPLHTPQPPADPGFIGPLSCSTREAPGTPSLVASGRAWWPNLDSVCEVCKTFARVPYAQCNFCQDEPSYHHGRCCPRRQLAPPRNLAASASDSVAHPPKAVVRCDGSCARCDAAQCALPMGHRDPSICYCYGCLRYEADGYVHEESLA